MATAAKPKQVLDRNERAAALIVYKLFIKFRVTVLLSDPSRINSPIQAPPW